MLLNLSRGVLAFLFYEQRIAGPTSCLDESGLSLPTYIQIDLEKEACFHEGIYKFCCKLFFQRLFLVLEVTIDDLQLKLFSRILSFFPF